MMQQPTPQPQPEQIPLSLPDLPDPPPVPDWPVCRCGVDRAELDWKARVGHRLDAGERRCWQRQCGREVA